ncbi:MAG: DUF2520 domain-containing protein [Candidatus Marinimicrobia bacterium]|nr:DUF2520 domain-containing protein [Candidatus Neomarinimicrobiota bacterium]
MSRNISLIGAGRVGRSLLNALVNVGNNPVAIVSRSSRSAGSLAEMVRAPLFGEDYSLIPETTDLILLTLPDDSLESAVEVIKKDWKYKSGTLLIHTSGIKESSILEPLRECGAKTAAIHPVASFPAENILPLEGVHFAVEGKDKGMAMDLVRSIGGIPFHIDAGKKALYHAACTFASGYLNILLESSLKLMGEAGMEEARDVVTALAKSSVEGWNDNGVGSLTGSIARGDVESVRAHLKSLENSEEELGIYRILALKAVTECETKGILTREKAEELKAALN